MLWSVGQSKQLIWNYKKRIIYVYTFHNKFIIKLFMKNISWISVLVNWNELTDIISVLPKTF